MIAKIYYCPKCGSENIVKNGFTRHGNQRCLCHTCKKTSVLEPKKPRKEQFSQQIIRCFKERISILGICRVFKVSERSVFELFNLHAPSLPDMRSGLMDARDEDIIEFDELWSFCTDKTNKQWVWTALCRRTRQIVAYVIGDRSKDTFRRLLRKIPDEYLRRTSFSDHWPAYEMLLCKKNHKLVVGKESGQTAKMERWNATLRARVARFVRKSLCFSRKRVFIELCL
jgi:insertion element IS1 protein InsB